MSVIMTPNKHHCDTTMTDSLIAIRNFMSAFEKIYKSNPQQGRIALISVFATCFGLMTPEDRVKSLKGVISIAKDINVVLFEDGQDFATYLKEKSTEHQEGEWNDQID